MFALLEFQDNSNKSKQKWNFAKSKKKEKQKKFFSSVNFRIKFKSEKIHFYSPKIDFSIPPKINRENEEMGRKNEAQND